MKEMIIGTLLTLVLMMGFNQVKDSGIIFTNSTSDTNSIVDEFQPVVVAAFDNAEKANIDDTPVVPDDGGGIHPDPLKCICKGTGVITHGDGHQTICTYHGKKAFDIIEDYDRVKVQYNMMKARLMQFNGCACEVCECDECKCGNKKTSEVSVNNSGIRRKEGRPHNREGNLVYQLLIFTADWCGPCQAMKKDLEKLKSTNIKVGTSADCDIRFLNMDNYATYFKTVNGGLTGIPMILEVKDHRLLSREVGAKSVEEIIKRYDLEE